MGDINSISEYDNMESTLKTVMKKGIFTKDHRALVAKLRKARENAGSQQKDVARIIMRAQSFVSKLESGQRRIDVVHLKKLAMIYKEPVDFIIR